MRSARSYKEEADHLRMQGRTYSDIAAAWKERYDINSRVALRLAHGLTQAEVAQRWNQQWPDADCPKTGKHISYWEIWPGAAGRAPSYETLDRLAFLYQCSAGDLLDGEDHRHRDQVPSQPRSQLLPTSGDLSMTPAGGVAAVTPAHKIGTVTRQIVDDFATLTETYRRLDYREGSKRVSADADLHLRRILDICNRPTPVAVQRDLLRAAGDAAQLCAWLAIDGGKYRRASRYCTIAVSMADKSSDRALKAYALGIISYIHLHSGDGRSALNILQSARGHAGLPSALTSWLAEATGEAFGLVDDRRNGLAALAESERLFDGVANEEAPPWLAFFDADCHAARLKGRCLIRLTRPKEAIPALYEALLLLPATFVRERSGTLIDLASAYIRVGQIEQACDTAVLADQLARQTGSERNRKRLRELLLEFLPWADQGCVKGLYYQVLHD